LSSLTESGQPVSKYNNIKQEFLEYEIKALENFASYSEETGADQMTSNQDYLEN